MLFAGLSGSAVADTSALGSMLIPAMEKQGYTTRFAAAITAASSVIGPIIPPSGIMIIYAYVMGESVEAVRQFLKNIRIRFVANRCAAIFRLAELFQLHHRDAALESHSIMHTVATNFGLEPFAQKVHARNTDAVKTAGVFINILLELAAHVKLGHHEIQS